MVAVPQLAEARLLDRRARRQPGVGDDDVYPAEGLDGGRERVAHGVLGRDVAVDGQPAVAQRRHRLRRSVAVEVEGGHARAGRGQRLDDGAPDPARRAGDERDRPLQLTGRRRKRQLVELQRPVLDGEALARIQRGEAAERVGAGHHLDRPVVEVP